MARSPAHALVTVLLLVPLGAQDHDELPTEHVAIIPPGGMVDLDTGLILRGREHRSFKADLRFDRDGAGFYLEPLFGGLAAGPGDVAPVGEWAPGRIRIARHAQAATVMFARTDRGVARVELLVADPYSTASAVLRWVVVPPKQPVFLPPPEELAANWVQGRLEVTWKGEHTRWLIEVHSDGRVRKETTGERKIQLDGLSMQGLHRIFVRGLTAANEVSMPGEVVQHGARRPPERGVLEFPDRWYDKASGIKLSDGTVAVEDAEVVLYLYGVSVPGGGVLKMGSGASAYAALSELPARGYPPVYGRLDDHDVLAVRLRDGRYGKLWLEPAKSDVRSGMRVHFAFLADGRSRLLAPPGDAVFEMTAGGPRLRWQPSPGAVSYRITVPGKAAALAVTKPEVVLQELPPDRLFDCELVAVGEDGAISDVSRAPVHTYGPDAKVGRGTLQAQSGGFVFASGQSVKDAKESDLALTGGAGGSAWLSFTASGGAAPGGKYAFGEFTDGKQLTFQQEVGSDTREVDSERFYVRTADGGMASVRIVERGWPKTVIEYVWLPKR